MRTRLILLLTALLAVAPAASAEARSGHPHPHRHRLVTGLEGGAGSTVGPDGALYVTETAAGRVTRVDPRTGATRTYATGLPKAVTSVGGAMDIAFIGRTAYVLVTFVGPDVGGSDTVGIYRIDSPDRSTVVADIGAWSIAHPPKTPFDVPTGVQYALQPFHRGLLVTDGHHNRVLRVSPGGTITELIAFGNIVPTGLAAHRGTVYVAQAGPVPHLPEDGRIVSFRPGRGGAHEVAAGGRLLVDVEIAHGHRLYALSQGVWPAGKPEGSPALPGTGALLALDRHGSLTRVAGHLDRRTSLEIIRGSAYVVTLAGEIWRLDGLAA